MRELSRTFFPRDQHRLSACCNLRRSHGDASRIRDHHGRVRGCGRRPRCQLPTGTARVARRRPRHCWLLPFDYVGHKSNSPQLGPTRSRSRVGRMRGLRSGSRPLRGAGRGLACHCVASGFDPERHCSRMQIDYQSGEIVHSWMPSISPGRSGRAALVVTTTTRFAPRSCNRAPTSVMWLNPRSPPGSFAPPAQ